MEFVFSFLIAFVLRDMFLYAEIISLTGFVSFMSFVNSKLAISYWEVLVLQKSLYKATSSNIAGSDQSYV